MAGFSEFLLNNMKSNLEPEDLKLFNQMRSNVKVVNNKSKNLALIKENNNIRSHPDDRYESFDDEYSTEDDDYQDEDNKFNAIHNAKHIPLNQNLSNKNAKYGIVSNKPRLSVKGSAAKEKNTTKKSNKFDSYGESWKHLANKYYDACKAKEKKLSQNLIGNVAGDLMDKLKSPDVKIKNFVTKTLEKTKALSAVKDSHFNEAVNLTYNVAPKTKKASNATISALESETNSSLSQKITNNPIYVSDSKFRDILDNEYESKDLKTESVSIDFRKPNILTKDNLLITNMYKTKKLTNIETLKAINDTFDQSELDSKNKNSLSHTVKFEINQLLVENNCKILKSQTDCIKTDSEIENTTSKGVVSSSNTSDTKNLRDSKGLLKAFKAIKIAFNKKSKSNLSESNLNSKSEAISTSPSNAKKNQKLVKKSKRTGSGKSTNNSSTNSRRSLIDKKLKKNVRKANRRNSKYNSSSSGSSKGALNLHKSETSLNCDTNNYEANIYSNNTNLNQIQTQKVKKQPDGKAANKNINNDLDDEKGNYKYRSKLNPVKISLSPSEDQTDNKSKTKSKSLANESNLSNNSQSKISNSTAKTKQKNKEKLLDSWDKVIKKASNDPQSLKELLKLNATRNMEENKKKGLKLNAKINKTKPKAENTTSFNETTNTNTSNNTIGLMVKLNKRLNQKNIKKEEVNQDAKKNIQNSDEIELKDFENSDENAEKKINEMLTGAATAGKQGELIKNLFAYLNNYGDDGFTIKPNASKLNNSKNDATTSESIHLEAKTQHLAKENQANKINQLDKTPLGKQNHETKKLIAKPALTDIASASSAMMSLVSSENVNNKMETTSARHTESVENIPSKNNNNSSNMNHKFQKFNFNYYLKCCVDKNMGPESTIGSRNIDLNDCQETSNDVPTINSVLTEPKAIKNETNKLKTNSKNSNMNLQNNLLLNNDRLKQLDVEKLDLLIKSLDGEGQEFLKKKLSFYLKSRQNLDSADKKNEEKEATNLAVPNSTKLAHKITAATNDNRVQENLNTKAKSKTIPNNNVTPNFNIEVI